MSDRYNFRRSTRVKQLPPHRHRGPPQDPTPRIALKVEELDLEKSYVGTFVSPKRQRPKKSRPWAKQTGTDPITDPAKLPRGWHMKEDDLEHNDIDGQIERCHERIAENIMPHVFQQRLQDYTAAKVKEDDMRFPGSEELSWETVQRVHELETMKTDLASTTDDYEQLPNIGALLEAYTSGELHWNTGLVTYWWKGAQVSQPRPFDWDEFEAINSHHQGYKGFWVEGICGLENESSYAAMTLFPHSRYQKLIGLTLAIRLPGIAWFAELEFIHDTGCSRMTMFQADLSVLLGPFGGAVGPRVPVICMSTSNTGNGLVTREVIEVEVTILDGNRQRMIAWTRTFCNLVPGGWSPNGAPRLDGPIVSDLLYVASVPNGIHQLYVSTTRFELGLPDLNLATNPGQHMPTVLNPLPPGTFATTHGPWLPSVGGNLWFPPAASGVP
ncbi:hypothetical protein N7537_011766 [Penicillium hordei]|uniref:Uncharacterized protein n=1 Tax=Penicillium hordei TaxID=40994 RepID=A0AAD6DMF2_9EURO|nr:uncharacterized protein N7537_011766 [Penicillium hordei]KAJ5589088.1 hypothetical protein N7537_011766 [Penicillium hordei]